MYVCMYVLCMYVYMYVPRTSLLYFDHYAPGLRQGDRVNQLYESSIND